MINCQEMISKKVCGGDCCGCVPIPIATWYKHQTEIQRPFINLVEGKEDVYPLTEDFKCVFLTPELKCKIYEDRPEICVKFGMDNFELACPHSKPNGNLRSEASQKQVKRRMAQFQKGVLKQLRGSFQDQVA